MIPNYKQNYVAAEKRTVTNCDLGFITLGRGEFIHIQADNQAVEIVMDDDGNIGVCVSKHVTVSSFDEIYGGRP